jgi:hypothetical protein
MIKKARELVTDKCLLEMLKLIRLSRVGCKRDEMTGSSSDDWIY